MNRSSHIKQKIWKNSIPHQSITVIKIFLINENYNLEMNNGVKVLIIGFDFNQARCLCYLIVDKND